MSERIVCNGPKADEIVKLNISKLKKEHRT
jgi:hypothetical protein